MCVDCFLLFRIMLQTFFLCLPGNFSSAFFNVFYLTALYLSNIKVYHLYFRHALHFSFASSLTSLVNQGFVFGLIVLLDVLLLTASSEDLSMYRLFFPGIFGVIFL